LKIINGWTKPKEINPKTDTMKFFGSSGNVRPEGISQRSIGDCWFLAGLAALAEKPERYNLLIEKAHREDDWNSAGIFRFYFHAMG